MCNPNNIKYIFKAEEIMARLTQKMLEEESNDNRNHVLEEAEKLQVEKCITPQPVHDNNEKADEIRVQEIGGNISKRVPPDAK